MKRKNRNGIKILNVEAEKYFARVASEEEVDKTKVAKKPQEGLNPLGNKIKTALRKRAAKRKTAEKTANIKKLQEAAEKRALQRALSAANAAKLLRFLRGELASFAFSSLEENEIEAGKIRFDSWEDVKAFLEEGIRHIPGYNETMKIIRELNSDDYVFFSNVEEDFPTEAEIIKSFWREIKNIVSFDPVSRHYILGYINTPEAVYSSLLYYYKNEEPWLPENDLSLNGKMELLRKWGRYRKAIQAGIMRPDLARYYNIDTEAFKIIDECLVEEYGSKEKLMEATGSHLGYDSYGRWGISPYDITKAWYASGCKPGGKFILWAKRTIEALKRDGELGITFIPVPRKGESYSEYKNRLRLEAFIHKWDIRWKITNLRAADRRRIAKLGFAVLYYAINECVVETDTRVHSIYCNRGHIKEIDWEKVAKFTKLNKKEKATHLPLKLAWSLLFKRKAPIGLGDKDPSPVMLTHRATQKTFRKVMEVVKAGSPDMSALAANTKAAYHLAIVFPNMGMLTSWVKKVTGVNEITPTALHDSFVDAKWVSKVKYTDGWRKLLLQFPELRWQIHTAPGFEKEYNRLPSGKREFEEFASMIGYEDVESFEIAKLAGKYDLDQDDFETIQKLYLKHPGKKATMLPNVVVSETTPKGDIYEFSKLDDHDPEGLFLGYATKCCMTASNVGWPCTKAGWKQPESGFYVIRLNGEIVVQSWAWRGKKGELCFDSIEGRKFADIGVVARLYERAAQMLLGKLGITRVTVGDTPYGLTEDVKDCLGGKNCKAAKMIISVSYTDADDQWLLAE